jgi:hypothetical protein
MRTGGMKPWDEYGREAVAARLEPGEHLRALGACQTQPPLWCRWVFTPLVNVFLKKTYWVGITDRRAILAPRAKTYLGEQLGARRGPSTGIVAIPLDEVAYTAVPKQPVTLTLPGSPKPLRLLLVYFPGLRGYPNKSVYVSLFVAALKRPT